jgi:hypothetical protein
MRHPREGIIVFRYAGCEIVAAAAWIGCLAKTLLTTRDAGACFIQSNKGW